MSWFARIFGKSRPASTGALSRKDLSERRRKSSPVSAGAAAKSTEPLRRHSDRAVRRELLHTVVREAMLGQGVLSSHFKFKVMSLDQQGSQFMVMVDLSDEVTQDLTDLAALESVIIQRALSHRKLQIKAVYWRMTDRDLVLPPSARGKGHAAQAMGHSSEHSVPHQGTHPSMSHASKPVAHAVEPGVATPSGFPITELPEGSLGARPVGSTQYGDLI